ncbi:MAG TPA: hypothetical protein VMT03_16100 [Polyangia bacterium]|nr:hypothetical protein [Polyangia bacterium]
MLTRTLATLTLLLLSSTAGLEPRRPATPRPERLRHARVIDDVEGCRVPPPAPEPVAPASCDDGRSP